VNRQSIKPLHLQLSLLFLAFLALYYPFIQTLMRDWDANDNYNHGYFIPIVSAFMIWSLREELAAIEIKPSNWGIALVGLGLLQLFIAKVGSEYFLQRTSMIVVLFGISFYLFGGRLTRTVQLPLVYLIFMIPLPAIIWNRIAFPMQLFASSITEDVVRLIGLPILREGNVLHLAQTTLEVVDACSGLRSLVTMLALGTAFAFITHREAWKRWVLFLSVFPIAVAVNIIRLSATAILASRYGSEVAHGFLHDFSGWVVFVAGIAMLFGVEWALSRIGKAEVVKDGAGPTAQGAGGE
jgi:exosortase